MNETVYERIKMNLEALNMRNTLEIIDNYLEMAISDKTNIVEVLIIDEIGYLPMDIQ